MTQHDPAGGPPTDGGTAGSGRISSDDAGIRGEAAAEWLTQAELSRVLGVSEPVISKAISRARRDERPLPPHKVDAVTGRRKFQLDTFEPWLHGLPRRGRPQRTNRT